MLLKPPEILLNFLFGQWVVFLLVEEREFLNIGDIRYHSRRCKLLVVVIDNPVLAVFLNSFPNVRRYIRILLS